MKKLFCAAAAAVALTGCALTTDRIELKYPPQSNVAPVAGANAVRVQVQVSDQRADKAKVGSKKNGFGMEMAPILATEDVGVTVKRAIEQELQARGFQLGAKDSLVNVGAEVVRFYNDHKNGFFAGDAVAEINLAVRVTSPSGAVLYTRNVAAQGLEPNIQLASGDNAKLALDRALVNGMRALFEDQAFIEALLSATKG